VKGSLNWAAIGCAALILLVLAGMLVDLVRDKDFYTDQYAVMAICAVALGLLALRDR
jgi:hypothetical protein